MNYIQVGETALRMPNGDFKESVPVFKECKKMPVDIAEDFFEDKTAIFFDKAYTCIQKRKALKKRRAV